MKQITIILFLIIFLPVFSFSQYTNIRIDNTGVPEEPTICINPNNTQQLIAGTNLSNYYYSNNGGLNWTEGTLTSSFGVYGDPCVVCDTNGSFYYFHLSNTTYWIDRIVCQKTTDMGATWNNGSYTGLNGTKAQDKEWVTIDRENNNIYVSWTQFDEYGSANENDSSIILFSRSLDASETWSEPIRISETAGDCIDDDYTTEGAVPAVGIKGEIFIAWAGRKTNGALAIMFDKSEDYGETWLANDIFVTDFPNGWTFNIPGISRCNGLPITCCDTSNSPYRGTIYINWSDQRNGTDDTDIWLVKSTDSGETWSEPIRVNDDPAGSQQFFTWFTIDQTTGYLYFVFYDRRNYTDNNTDVYLAKSTDGGNTFENIKISESPFIPSSSIFFGDYNNITAYDGIIRPIWTRLDNGDLSIWTAIINEEIPTSIVKPKINIFSVKQNYPNPFSEETFIEYEINQDTYVSLKIFDFDGNELLILIDNEFREKGMYVDTFNTKKSNLFPGVYYFSVICGEEKIIKKMVIIK